MRKLITLLALTLAAALAVPVPSPAAAGSKEIEKERKEIRAKAHEILEHLYKEQPDAKAVIKKAAGYAVFSNFGMKILAAGGGSGKGIAVDRRTKKETFMKMVEVQAGLGFGAKKFSVVWVFDDPGALDKFIEAGWELGGQASAAAKSGETGQALQGAVSVSPGVWLYQLTDQGLAMELTAKGTRYYKDPDLN